MESEAYFLFIVYLLEEKPYFIENSKEIRELVTYVKRACMQRSPDRGDGQSKRIPIDFDPLKKEMAYIVIVYVDHYFEGIIYRNRPRFAHIAESEKEAIEYKDLAEKGNYIHSLEKHDKFRKVEIVPVLITQV